MTCLRKIKPKITLIKTTQTNLNYELEKNLPFKYSAWTGCGAMWSSPWDSDDEFVI